MSAYPIGEPTGIFIDLDEPQTKYRHSLFFQDEEEAFAATVYVEEMYDQCDKSYGPAKDTDTGIWEYRFYTKEKLSEREQRIFLKATEMKTLSSYALNVEDHS